MLLKHMRPHQLRDAVARGLPLLVPAGCIELHGPHMALGHDTLIVEAVCERLAQRLPCVIAPSIEYGPTGYALSGPEGGTIDVDYAGYYETSFLLAAHPELVEQKLLDADAPWYCEIDKPLSSATATAAFGEEMLAAVVAAWVVELGRL